MVFSHKWLFASNYEDNYYIEEKYPHNAEHCIGISISIPLRLHSLIHLRQWTENQRCLCTPSCDGIFSRSQRERPRTHMPDRTRRPMESLNRCRGLRHFAQFLGSFSFYLNFRVFVSECTPRLAFAHVLTMRLLPQQTYLMFNHHIR